MTDEARPIYVGCGTCNCQRVDVHLYHVPNTSFARSLLCKLCLEKNGFSVPRSRTAADIVMVDGKPEWKK